MYTDVISKKEIVHNDVKREPFEVINVSTDTNDTAVLLENVEFTVILKRYVDFYGSFEEALKHTDEYADDEYYVMTTDSKGYCVTKPLAYGTYIRK